IIMTTVGMILFEKLTQLDLTGPYEVFARHPDVRVLLLGKELEPVHSDTGLTIMPTQTLDGCTSNLDVLFIPGGSGISQVMTDQAYIRFIKEKAMHARYI